MVVEIESQVTRFLHSAAERRHLALWSRDGQTVYARLSYEDGVCNMVVTLDVRIPLRERAVRQLFRERGIIPDSDWAGDHIRHLRYPLPDGNEVVAHLSAELVKQVYGLVEQDELEYEYAEKDAV